MQSNQRVDSRGYFGQFGGQYVPETLMCALAELEQAYSRFLGDPSFVEELDGRLRDYVLSLIHI